MNHTEKKEEEEEEAYHPPKSVFYHSQSVSQYCIASIIVELRCHQATARGVLVFAKTSGKPRPEAVTTALFAAARVAQFYRGRRKYYRTTTFLSIVAKPEVGRLMYTVAYVNPWRLKSDNLSGKSVF